MLNSQAPFLLFSHIHNHSFLSFKNEGSLSLLLSFRIPPFHPCRSPYSDTLQAAYTTFSISFPFLHLLHSTAKPLYLSMDIHRSACFLLIAEWYGTPRIFFSVRWPRLALSERCPVGHPPYRICHWIVLIPTSSLMTFPGEASTITFSVAKLVQAVFCKYQRLIPWIFSKTFCRLCQPIKTFHGPKVK